MYPLTQKDTLQSVRNPSVSSLSTTSSNKESVMNNPAVNLITSGENDIPTVDFTPAQLITLLFTDLGVLTPAAVSDELIKLYQ
jgi:translation initiation factor 2B subunit (eIF-2B alpha/beta/delta family)